MHMQLTAGLVLGLFLGGPAFADWQTAACATFGPNSETVEIRLTPKNEWIDAIRLSVASGKTRVNRIKVRFHNDETQKIDLDKTLASGERTRKLALTDAPRRLKSFELNVEEASEGGTRLCIEALPGEKTSGKPEGGWTGDDYRVEVLCRREAEDLGFSVLNVGKVREVQKRPPVRESRMSVRNRGVQQTLICRYDVDADLATFYGSDRPSEQEIATLRECRQGATKLDYRVVAMGDVHAVDAQRGASEVRLKVRSRETEKRLTCRYHSQERLATFYAPR